MVTILDVAKHAGVAPSTVSYVLTGKRAVSAGTRVRVRQSMELLGYRPCVTSAHSRTNVLALVLPLREGVHLPVVMRFVTAVVTAAREHGMDVRLVTADGGAAGLRGLANGGRADAFLVMDVELDDERVPVLREMGRPAVLIGHPAAVTGLTCIDLDFEAAGARCVDHLADLGHHTIGFLGAPSVVYARNTGFARRTLAGFRAAAVRRGLTSTALPTEAGGGAADAGVGALLAELPEVSALVVQNEAVLGRVVECLRAEGRRVPDDVTVMAICPDELAGRLRLTSIQLPVDVLARRAVELVMAKLDGRQPPALTLLPPKLSPRSSFRR
ncbi:LacI family DNA-binding transcriptional regulator [Lentzea sp. NPDC003310]|uniref:LacI family DNA-binding transcriptional regulator n=1 Tax=Lentzea sp. NPDC003310 TaxID=3154447 RepID=UPI0033AAB9C1